MRFVFTGQDARAFLVLLVSMAVLGVCAFFLRRRLAGLLTAREWRIALKLQGIVLMVLLLMMMNISLEYPAEMFIYGRF